MVKAGIGILRQIIQGEHATRVKYFSDTDTALVQFTNDEVAETREISENIYVDLDRQRNPVNMTIEHARTNAQLPELSYQEQPDKHDWHRLPARHGLGRTVLCCSVSYLAAFLGVSSPKYSLDRCIARVQEWRRS